MANLKGRVLGDDAHKGQAPAARLGKTRPDRLISTGIVLLGVAVAMMLPLLLSAGKVFFVPLALAVVLTVTLSPLADALARLGLYNTLASLAAIFIFLGVMALCVFVIVQPALGLVAEMPRLLLTINSNIAKLQHDFSVYLRIGRILSRMTGPVTPQVVVATPSFLEQAAYATPQVMFETLVTLLTTFLMIESRIRMRRRVLLQRSDLDASLRAARTLRDVQARLSTWLGSVTIINAMLGVLVGLVAWACGLQSPVMWGGLAAVLNYLPYFGPAIMAALMAAVSLGTSPNLLTGALAPALYLAIHAVETNVVTPSLLGRRFAVSPVAILVSISFFTWVWGAIGAVLATPLLIMMLALGEHLGRPNLIGFLFGEELFLGKPAIPETENSAGPASDQDTNITKS
ncbi:MAG: AI-2E family transporter [Pseudomonadota bacterium]|nr:AI-2E family transporter [Pseudomonadota bacterium]